MPDDWLGFDGSRIRKARDRIEDRIGLKGGVDRDKLRLALGVVGIISVHRNLIAPRLGGPWIAPGLGP